MSVIKINDFGDFGNWINNHDKKTSSVKSIKVLSPYFDKQIATIPDSNSHHLDEAVNTASDAFRSWSKTNIRDRAQIMSRFKSIIEEDIDNLAAYYSSL